MKTLIMLSAVPASGKSTWAYKYQSSHENTYIVSSDQIRMEITHSFQDHSQQPLVWKTFEDRIHQFGKIDDVTVILDALNDTNEVRLKYLKSTPEFDKKILVLFPNTFEKSSFFNKQRQESVRVPEDILVALVNKFEKPSKEVLDLVDEVQEITW